MFGPLIRILEEGTGKGKEDASLLLGCLVGRHRYGDSAVADLMGEGVLDPLVLWLMEEGGLVYGGLGLWNLLAHHFNLEGLVEVGIRPVVDLLRLGSTISEVAAGVIQGLAESPENAAKWARAGAVGALIKLLKEGSSETKAKSALALYKFAAYAGNKVTLFSI